MHITISPNAIQTFCQEKRPGFGDNCCCAEIHNDFIGRDEVQTYENMKRQGNDNLQAANASSDNHDNRSDNGQAGGNTVPLVHAEPSPIQCYEDALSVYEVYIL